MAVTFDDAFQNVFDHALPILAKYDIPATVFVPTGFLGRQPGWMVAGDGDAVPEGPVVRSADLAAVDARRVRIGSHTVSHPRLSALDVHSVWTELTDSKKTLEAVSGRPVTMLSLPYGAFTRDVLAAAGRAGYELVFANIPVGAAATTRSGLAGRTNVTVADWPLEFDLKIAGAYEWLVIGISIKRSIAKAFSKAF